MSSESYPITSSAMELNASTHKLMAAIARIEKAFAAYRFGTETVVAVKDERLTSIGYQRVNGSWGITVDAEGSVDSIVNVRRDIRIAAIRHMPKLFEEMKMNAAALRERIESVLPEAAEFAEQLERNLGKW